MAPGEKYKGYVWPIIGALVFCVLFIGLQNILSGEESRVRKFILRGKRAAEAKDILTCAGMISMSYQDKYGNDRSSLIYAAKDFFAYYRKVFIKIDNIEIKLDETKKHAEVEIVALVIGQSEQNNLEKILEGEKGRFRVSLAKEENKWRLLEIEFFEPITVMGQSIS